MHHMEVDEPMGLQFFLELLDIAEQDCETADIVVTDPNLIIKAFIDLEV